MLYSTRFSSVQRSNHTAIRLAISSRIAHSNHNRDSQSFCKVTLATIMNGLMKPSGSNSAGIFFKTFRLVIGRSEATVGTESVETSLLLSHDRPRVLTTGSLLSAMVSCAAWSSVGISAMTFLELETHFLACIPALRQRDLN